MSASLVGSEMCIRDRLRRAPELLLPAAGRPRAQDGLSGLWPATRGKQAVSYTHLTLPTICSV
eukprot:7968661-Alexandrium_andersonii.AAC.1